MDLVLTHRGARLFIEGESGRLQRTPSGLAAFEKADGPARKLVVVGSRGPEVEAFLRMDPGGI